MRASVHQSRAPQPDATASRTAVPASTRLSHRMSTGHRTTDRSGLRSNQAVQRSLQARTDPPAASMIGPVVGSDAQEREADRMAAAVMRMPDGRVSSSDRMVARQIDDFGGSQPVEDMDEEAAGALAVHRQPADPSGVPAAPADLGASIDRVGKRGGQPLSVGTRQFMEARFGGDFAGVRIHTDRAAGDLVHRLQARAFTTGHRVFFAPGEFQPESASGRRLLAHELAHVIQQRQGPRSADRAVQFKKTGCEACPPYCKYDTSKDLEDYNCSGLSRRTYDYLDATAARAALADVAKKRPCADPCPQVGMVKHWFWEYDWHLQDSKGKTGPVQQDYHTVSGPTAGDDPKPKVGGPKPKAGALQPTDSDECYSKDGQRKVYGPGSCSSFKPAAQAPATDNLPSEPPLMDPWKKQMVIVRSNITESCYCLPCPKTPTRKKTTRKKR